MGKSSELNRIKEDRQFLRRLRECCDIYDLERMHTNHSHNKAPEWKKAAIRRRLEQIKRATNDPDNTPST